MVHASLRRIGAILGGAETLLAALMQVFPGVMAPTFTYKTMITPRLGPPRNGIDYLAEQPHNYRAEFFRADLPADPLMGSLPETLRRHPLARRTSHPILSLPQFTWIRHWMPKRWKVPWHRLEFWLTWEAGYCCWGLITR
ncbi:MAG: AAC(3) family N-acetyltransferase [Anaerolineales bacterium]